MLNDRKIEDHLDSVVKESEIKGITVKSKKDKNWFSGREKSHVAVYKTWISTSKKDKF